MKEQLHGGKLTYGLCCPRKMIKVTSGTDSGAAGQVNWQFNPRSDLMKFALTLLTFLSLLTGPMVSQANNLPLNPAGGLPVASLELDWYDKSRQRPVKVTLWYPKSSQSCVNTAGQPVQVCLHPDTKTDQTAMFSHGAMGAAKGYQWIGRLLAAQGIVTIGLNHYGESWIYGPEHINHSTVLQFALRPQDARFVLDQLEQRQAKLDHSTLFSQPLNWQNLTAIGHSSGGATMLALAGARFQLTLALDYCQKTPASVDRSCGYLPAAAVLAKVAVDASANYQDPRVQRVIALDPAMGHLVLPDSLTQLQVPVLLVGSVQNDFLPYDQHAGWYAAHLPQVQSIRLEQGEGHFVYLDACRHAHQALGVSLCQDKTGVDRTAVQQQLAPALLQFIAAMQP